MEACSLYKRRLWVAPCVPNINNEWDPPVMKRSLLVQPSKRSKSQSRGKGVNTLTYATKLDDTNDSFLGLRNE